MTIAKDHSGKRKPSWDSKISVSSGSTRPVGRSERSETPSSILSSDSDIRFTRKLGGQYRCGCCIVAVFLLFLLVAAVIVYLSHKYFLTNKQDESVFRVNFRVIEGDSFYSKLANPATEDFRIHSRNYRERLNLIFKRSYLRPAFLKTEILALDGYNGQDLVVHFNAHFDPHKLKVETYDLEEILKKEIETSSPYLANLTISQDSVIVRESNIDITTIQPSTTKSTTLISTTTPKQPVVCTNIQLQYCNRVAYTTTAYPNLLQHRGYNDVMDDVIAFRELVDAECYRLAYDFVCQVLQPQCVRSNVTGIEDRIVLPCRSFCKDFMKGCGERIPERLKERLDCNNLPETRPCLSKPGCTTDLQTKMLEKRICDGVVDCEDLSDEVECSYCPSHYIHCGAGKVCIPKNKRCDGHKDCPSGIDEKNCLTVTPSSSVLQDIPQTTHQQQYHNKGYVVFNEGGRSGKLCTETLNNTLIGQESDGVLKNVAATICDEMTYEEAESYTILEDTDTGSEYVVIEDAQAEELSFIPANCPSKQVLQIHCGKFQCGVQSLRARGGITDLNKMALHGDWPWHTALYKENIHICDGTLLSNRWIITTASCFQGQSKAEWVARFGAVRLQSSTPWEQERKIIGLVKSPVEGSTLVLIRMDEPVMLTDFVRPACLPDSRSDNLNYTICNTLGWSKTKEHLQRVDLRMATMEKCENISIATVNSVCTESSYLVDDCNEEEFAGSPLICLKPDNKWVLTGVSNWRIACTMEGTERPRLYDKTRSNIEWIQQTINETKR